MVHLRGMSLAVRIRRGGMKMKSILLDVYNNKAQVVNPEGLEDYYNMIDCSTVDIVRRKIGRKWFEIICDDEGTFKEDCKISAIDNFGNVMLVGNLIICGLADSEGELTDLSYSDVKYIRERIQCLSTRRHPKGYLMLTQCGY